MMEEPVIDGMDLPGDMMEEPVIDGMDLPGDMMEEPVIDGMDLPGDMMEESVHEIIETMPLESPEISQDVADWIHGGITQETDTDWDEEIPLGQEDSWFTEDLSSGESLDDGDEEISDKWQEYTGLGHEFLEKGDLDKALSNFNIAMEYNPRSAERYADRAMAYIRLDKTAEALSDLNRAIELDPQEAGYYLSRAKIHHQMQNLHWALQDCEMVSELSPFSQLAQEAQDLAGELSGS